MSGIYDEREQSQTKHLILKEYLAELALKTLLGGWTEFTFIDGFSGPWESRAEGFSDTSFGIALETLDSVQRLVEARKSELPRVRLVFCEKNRASFEKLSAHCSEAASKTKLEVHCLNGSFEELVPELLKLTPSGFRLTFVDPTGWSGYALNSISPLFRRREDEVIVNFMYDFINRFVESDDPAIQDSLVPILGENVRERISASPAGRQEAISGLFRENLRHSGGFRYTLTAPVSKPLADRPLFMLAYGTKSYSGLETFRKIERRAMSAYAAVRARAKEKAQEERSGQPSLFVTDDSEAKREFEEGLDLVRSDAAEFLREVVFARSPERSFKQVAAALMARLPLTKTDAKAICVELANGGFLEPTWKERSPRARGPNEDDKLRVRR
ncbi:MAG: three-Cys-motif partner protein TcmP [Oceanicaulis sp.]